MTHKNHGEGHKAHISLVAKATIEIDGKKQQFNIDYDVTITVEMIDYAIRKIASGIAQVADDVARNGIGRKKEAVSVA